MSKKRSQGRVRTGQQMGSVMYHLSGPAFRTMLILITWIFHASIFTS